MHLSGDHDRIRHKGNFMDQTLQRGKEVEACIGQGGAWAPGWRFSAWRFPKEERLLAGTACPQKPQLWSGSGVEK